MGTLIWTDNFESYTAGSPITSPWSSVTNSPVVTAQAHAGTKSLAAGSGGNNSSCTRTFGSNLSQWYADFWMWTNSSGATTSQYVSFSSNATSGGAPSINVAASGAGQAGWANGSSWITFSVSLGAWHHYLFEVRSAASGSAKLTVDGVVVGTYSGSTKDGGGSGNAFAAQIWVIGASIGPSPPAEFYIDDLSIYSGTTGAAKGLFHTPFSQRLSFPSPALAAALLGVRAIRRNKIITRRGLVTFSH